MAHIKGTISDEFGNKLENVSVTLLDERFEVTALTSTNNGGSFEFQVPDGHYPYLAAVKDYAKSYLEYWCLNLHAYGEINISAAIGKLEIYGLHCFQIMGAYPALMVYFRPMSLTRFHAGAADTAPIFDKTSIQASINGCLSQIYTLNKVEEYTDEGRLTAWLMQISLPDSLNAVNANILDVKLTDTDKCYGQASVFF